MNIVTIDFESYWANDYTLSSMSPLSYVMGDRYETISCAVKVNDDLSTVYFGHDAIAEAFAGLDIPNSALLGHNNSGFDCYIAAYRFGLRPKMWLCTAAMARAKHAKTIGVSLAKLVQHYGVGVKDNAVLMATKGKYLKDFTEQEIADMAIYNQADTDQCYALFKVLRKDFSPLELWQIDAVVRQRTEPQFELDRGLLETALSVERSNKHKHLLELAKMVSPEGVDWGDEDAITEKIRSELASAAKFSALLESRGVEVPMKPSPSDPESGKKVPALAKSDEEFVALQEHDDPIVAAAASARLSVKSTLLETRIEKFLEAGALAGGMLPIPIRYAGADTTWRDSGEEYNCLNLPRINPGNPKTTDALRNSLRAPKGKLVIVADQSNIELRVNHTLWKVKSSMDLWATDPEADLYRADAAATYGVAPEAVTKDQRQLSKVKALGLGFGSGADTFRRVAKIMAGLDLSKVMRYMTQEEVDAGMQADALDKDGYGMVVERDPAQEAVNEWRLRYSPIVTGWKTCHSSLTHIAAGLEGIPIDPWGLAVTHREGILLNTGRNHIIRYPKLRQEFDKRNAKAEWVYAEGRNQARIYAGKITENIVQALARDTIMDNTLEFFKRTGLRPALRPYDELAYVVDEAKAPELLAELLLVMRTPPKWWPELTVWAEGDIAPTYGAAK